MASNLEEEAVLLALPGVGDLPLGRAEAGVPAVVVALLLDEGVAASVRDLVQQTLLHALSGGAAQHTARGPGMPTTACNVFSYFRWFLKTYAYL